MKYLGDFETDKTVIIPFNTFDTSGASVTVTDLVAGDVEIHKDSGTTQRSSDAGVTVSIDFDGVTGNHLISIDLSDNTDAGFYASGHDYEVRVEGITVDSQTINAWVGSFSIENRYMVGTDSAYTGTPPTAVSIREEIDSNSTQLESIVGDTDELQTNQGNWVTATGFATPTDVTNAATSVNSNIDDNEAKIDTLTDNLQTVDDNVDGIAAELDSTPLNTLATSASITALPAAIWNYLTASMTTVGSIGKKLADWAVGTVSTNNDKTGYSLSNGAITSDVVANNALDGKGDWNTVTPDAAGTAPTSAEIVTAIKESTGYTEGGTYTFAEVVKILTAWSAGQWQDKSGVSGTYQVLDAEDGTTPVVEVTPSETSPQKTVSIL